MPPKCLLLGLAVLMLSCLPVSAATVSLNGSSGGAWESASTWVFATIPAAGDDVLITGSGTGAITISSNVTIASLTIAANQISLVSGTLNLGGVAIVAPVAAFSSSPAVPTVGQTVTFTDSTSNSPTSWAWSFGDGSTSTVQNPTHSYSSAGSYTVTLTASNAGGIGSVNRTVTVAVAAPVAAFSTSPTTPSVGQTIAFTDVSSNSPASWAWSFGDGSTSTAQNPTHSYTAAGSYTVTLTATNSGGFGSVTGTITVSSYPYPIVDTGQVKSYNASTEIAAPTSGQSFYGQDAQFSGLQPSYRDNGDGTISDLNTGLMWVSARGSKVTWDNAVAGAALNRTGGYTDWRMPTIKELYSLIDFNGKSASTDAQCIPYINTTYFEIIYGDVTGGRVIDGQDWSSTRYVSTTMNGEATIFGVNFIDGRIKGYPQYSPPSSTTGYTLYVRYVRGNSSYGVNDFVNHGDGTISDQATGLMWSQADSASAMNWQDALAWVQTKNAANYLGYSDWRLPNTKELQSLVDYTRSPATTGSATINAMFTCTGITNEGGVADYPFYWTGTTHLDSGGAAYLAFGRALGWMKLGTATTYTLLDVHGAGAQRSDPKSGSVSSYYLGTDSSDNAVYGKGPQGDVIRINNYVRLVRDAN